jgi:outer membrane protein assembly factor BamB
MVGYDATHAGHCPYPGPSSNAAHFSYATGGAIDSSPVIGSDGTLYVGSHDGKLHAVGRDGSLRWTFATGGEIHTSPAVAADGTIYVSSEDGKLYAVDATGKQKWSFQTGNVIEGSSPVFDAGGTVYVASNDKNIYAVSSAGSKNWAFTGGHASSLTASLASDGTVYWYPGVATSLVALTPQGAQKWSFTCDGGWFDNSPVVSALGHAYIVDEMSLGTGIFKDVGSDGMASGTIIQSVNLQPALDAFGNIVWASNNWDSPGWSLRLSSSSGVEKWRTALADNPTAPPTVDAAGNIYLPTDKGLAAYRGSDGTLLWSFPTPTGALTSAAIGPDGLAYVGHANGTLYAIGPER